VTPAFRQFVLDQLAELGDVAARSMFGGAGLYASGIFFGIISRDVLYLKVDAATRGAYERAGMGPFRPYADRPMTMQYFAVPAGVLESAPELTRWAKTAVQVAQRAAANPGRNPRGRRSLPGGS
jgi:DNA transformation protein